MPVPHLIEHFAHLLPEVAALVSAILAAPLV
jgi:hypothetical protein